MEQASRPLRVLFVSHSLPVLDDPEANVGGMQRVAEELYRALDAHPDVEVTLVGLRAPWKHIERLTTRFISRLLVSLPRLAREADADVILFSSMVTAGLMPAMGKRLRDIPRAVITHGLDITTPSRIYQWWVRKVFRSVDAVLPVSTATAAQCVDRGAAESDVFVCNNGVDASRFSRLPVRDDARRDVRSHLGLDPDSVMLLSVGRQVERKGTAWFVRSVMPLLVTDTHYVIAGSGPELEAIGAAALETGVSERVHVLGFVADEALKQLLRGSDLFLMPNIPVAGDMEGFGVVLMEAALSELYTVASALEGIRDAVSQPESGILVEPRNAAAFADAINELASDPDRLRQLGQSASDHVGRTFSWEHAVERYVQVLSGLVARKASA